MYHEFTWRSCVGWYLPAGVTVPHWLSTGSTKPCLNGLKSAQRGANSMSGLCRVLCRTVCRDYVGTLSGLCRTIVVSGIPGWSTRVEYQGVHGGVSDGNKVMGHVGMCEDTTSERELRKTGMSSLSRISLPSQPVSHHLPGPARRPRHRLHPRPL